VNHIVDKIAPETSVYENRAGKRRHGSHFVVAAMLVYSFLVYGQWGGRTADAPALFTAGITYFLAMYLYYGVARLAYQQHTYFLWGGATTAIVISYLLLGVTGLWAVLTGWSMLLFAGALSGRLTLTGHSQRRVYLVGAVTVAVIFTVQSLPMWGDFMRVAPEFANSLLEQWEQSLIGMGYSSDAVQQILKESRKLIDILIRIIPAVTVMSALLQFTVGYLAFVWWVDRNNRLSARLVPFVHWKVPFSLAPVVIISLLMRFFGGETLQLIGDNVLAIMTMYYCVAGLAVIEYYLRKLHVSRMMKVFFYVLMFFTQLIGFFVAALVGFVDSFAEWRKIEAPKS
jgi:uncharacterized protein YybS (DUF2232 family)